MFWKYCGKEEKLLLRSKFLLFSAIFCCLLVDLCVKTGTRFSLRDKRLFEISEFEITSRLYVLPWTPVICSESRGYLIRRILSEFWSSYMDANNGSIHRESYAFLNTDLFQEVMFCHGNQKEKISWSGVWLHQNRITQTWRFLVKLVTRNYLR